MEQERLEHARMLLDSGYSVTSAARHSGSGTDENLHRETRETAPSQPAGSGPAAREAVRNLARVTAGASGWPERARRD